MPAAQQGYDNLVEAGQDSEGNEDVIPTPVQEAQAQLAILCCCCCCCVGVFIFLTIGAMIFAPPEPRSAPGNVIWEPVLPANFSGCTTDYAMLWEMQAVHPPGVSCEEPGQVLGEWRQGWSIFSLYFYYVQTTNTGEEVLIHAQSAFKWPGQEWRLWRGDGVDAPVLTLSQDYWAEPWFPSDGKVRIFDVYQDELPVARMTEKVTGAWVGYGGAIVDIYPPPAAGQNAAPQSLLGRMSQPGVFWLVYFQPPAWEIQNFAPQDIPSAVPGFYALVSDIIEQEQATGPIFWIIFFCWCMTSFAAPKDRPTQ